MALLLVIQVINSNSAKSGLTVFVLLLLLEIIHLQLIKLNMLTYQQEEHAVDFGDLSKVETTWVVVLMVTEVSDNGNIKN